MAPDEALDRLDSTYHSPLLAVVRAEVGRLRKEVIGWKALAGEAGAGMEAMRRERDEDRRREYGYSQQTVDALTRERDALARQLKISRTLLLEYFERAQPPWQNPDDPLWDLRNRAAATFGGQAINGAPEARGEL